MQSKMVKPGHVLSALTCERLEQIKLVKNKWSDARIKNRLKNRQCKLDTASFEHNFENCILLFSLVKPSMANSTYLVAQVNATPFLVNLFQLF